MYPEVENKLNCVLLGSKPNSIKYVFLGVPADILKTKFDQITLHSYPYYIRPR